jgi:hypothetical protein
MPYRLIQQRVDERITCHGFSHFPQRPPAALPRRCRAAEAPHDPAPANAVHLPGYEPAGKRDAFLYQVGNREVVRCLAECNEVLTLLRRDEPYAELYTDLVRRSGAIIDAYPWLSHEEGFRSTPPCAPSARRPTAPWMSSTASPACKREAVERVTKRARNAKLRFQEIRRANFGTLGDYVHNLAALRGLRGELITLREVRYVDVAEIGTLEKQVVEETTALSEKCVDFLLQPKALEPYRENRRRAPRRRRWREDSGRRQRHRGSSRQRRCRARNAHRDRQQPAHRGCHPDDAHHRRHHRRLLHAQPGARRAAQPPVRPRRHRGQGAVRRADEVVRAGRLQLPRPLRHARQVRRIPQPPLRPDRGTRRPLRRLREFTLNSPSAAPNSTRRSSNARSPSSKSATAAPTRSPPPPSASSR